MADCEQPTRTPTKLRFRQFHRFILSRPTVRAQIRHGNPPFLRLTAEFERSEKPATSSRQIDDFEAVRMSNRDELLTVPVARDVMKEVNKAEFREQSPG